VQLLAFSDLHRDQERAERLVELASGADVVIGAGDYATMRIGLDGAIETLSAITVPTVLVPGNAGLRSSCGAPAQCGRARTSFTARGRRSRGPSSSGLEGQCPRLRFRGAST
jgi:hypothetical protein